MVDSPIGTFWYYCTVCLDFMSTHTLINGITLLDFLLIGIGFEILTWVIGQVISGMTGPEVGEDDDFIDIALRNSSDYGDHEVFNHYGKGGRYGRYNKF